VVRVEWTTKRIVFSTGEETYTPWEQMVLLATELCQEQAAVTYRSVATKRTLTEHVGNELIELHRAGESSIEPSMETRSEDSDVF
jgi:hypothetical protein